MPDSFRNVITAANFRVFMCFIYFAGVVAVGVVVAGVLPSMFMLVMAVTIVYASRDTIIPTIPYII